MIPRANITSWRSTAPWSTDAQIEQDLILSRALVEIFGNPGLCDSLAFRGGTALHKLFLQPPGRYSEDIDLVQTKAEPIGPTFDTLREIIEPWLGIPNSKRGPNSATLVFRFDTTVQPIQRMRLKIEINTREHFTVFGYQRQPFAIQNPWFTGTADIITYDVHELLATKMRALYQRRKGRDLYDLDRALKLHYIDERRIVGCFVEYMRRAGSSITRSLFEANLLAKIEQSSFRSDIFPLLADAGDYDPIDAVDRILGQLVSLLPDA